MKTRVGRFAFVAAALALAAAASGCPKKPVKVSPTPTPVETATPAPTPTPDLDAQMKGNAAPSGDQTSNAANPCGVDPVHFDYDSSTIRADALAGLKTLAACLAQHKTWTALLEGHTDERGSTQYNLALGERRARAVEKWLLDAGVEKARLQTVSYGAEKPVFVGHDETAWAPNRRVEFRITQK